MPSDELNLIAMENKRIVCEKILPLVKQAQTLSQKYDVVCTNPPYMGGSGMNSVLSEYVKRCYSEAKSDLFAALIIKCLEFTKQNGYSSLVTMQSWMFLSSFEEMRTKLLTLNTLTTLMHMENMVMGIAFGTAVSVFRKGAVKGYKGTYNQIKLADIENAKPKSFPVAGNRFAQVSSDNFSKIPGMPVAYWVSENFIKSFQYTTIEDFGFAGIGMRTGDNERFLRFWHEVDKNNIIIGCKSAEEQIASNKKWVPYNKGGEFRRWYGNNDYVVNWYNNGEEIKENTRKVYPQLGENLGWKISNEQYYFKRGITWSGVTSSKCSYRAYPTGFIFDSGANGLFVYDERNYCYVLGCLNNSISLYILSVINPTINTGAGTVRKIPLLFNEYYKNEIDSLVQQNIDLSKSDWDSFETSWDFTTHPLIKPVPLISESFAQWSDECEKRFTRLKSNEEELNRIFIDIYGLQDELTPDVDDKDVTVRKADLSRDIRSLISYAVGCMVGRYSLDKPGLAFAGGAWDASQYVTYPADKDGILPITDDEYFADDIVTMFVNWLKTVYGADTLEENLRFISDALGGKGSPREVIRNYFLNDFYKDHLKVYQKRPIYWLFDSGKKNGFKALVYMHRYQPDTIARVRTDYVHEMQSRYRTAIADVEQRLNDASTSERVKLTKRLNALQAQADELRQYEEKIHHLADQMIAIDLDDGVKVNYAKFADVLATIK